MSEDTRELCRELRHLAAHSYNAPKLLASSPLASLVKITDDRSSPQKVRMILNAAARSVHRGGHLIKLVGE